MRDPGLETAILISLFTDKRADDADVLPPGEEDKRGWWGDTPNYQMGSKIWLSMASKTTPDVLNDIKQYALGCIQWTITDGLSVGNEVEVSRIDTYTMSVEIKITEPSGEQQFYKYSYNWKAEEIRRSEDGI